jgi:hypothetical protein
MIEAGVPSTSYPGTLESPARAKSELAAPKSQLGFTWHRVLGALLLAAVILSVARGVQTMRAIGETASLTRLSEDEAQRRVNGPVIAYARALKGQLPLDSCLQLINPATEPNQAQRPYAAGSASALAHTLHPVQVRVVSTAAAGLAAEGCGTRQSYILVWIEPSNQTVADLVTADLNTLRQSRHAVLLSSYVDRDQNSGYVFQVLN